MGSQLMYILMALFWAGLEDEFSLGNLLVGYVVGVAIVALVRYLLPTAAVGRYVPRPRQLLYVVGFVGRLLWEIALANLVVLRHVLRPTMKISPGIIAVPADVRGDAEVTALGNSITLTPGTWTMEVAPDHSVLYVHALDAADAEEVKRSIKERLEKHILRVSRC